MPLSKEILEAQAEYAARPFLVMWRDSHAQVPCRFNTFDEAFDYVQQMWAYIRMQVKKYPRRSSDLWHSYLQTPECKVRLCDYLLCNDVSSY